MKPSDEVVILRPLYNTDLVYHRRDKRNRFRDIEDYRHRYGVLVRVLMATMCGFDTHWVEWDRGLNRAVQGGRSQTYGTHIRVEYADLFARPCRKCFPWGLPSY